MKFKLEKGYSGNIILQEFSVLRALKQLTDKQLKLYLYISVMATNKKNSEIEEITENLSFSQTDLADNLAVLEKLGFIKFSSDCVTFLTEEITDTSFTKPTVTNEDIKNVSEKEIKELVTAGERCFKKLLSNNEINTLINIKTHFNFETSVLVVLLGYVETLEKKSMAYIEKTAIDWYEKEIFTVEKAHDYIKELEENKTAYSKMCSMFNLQGRPKTKKAESYAVKWLDTYTDDKLIEAYEKTIDATGKLSFEYMDKVLEGKQDVSATPKKRLKPTNFSNFTQQSSDFDEIKKRKMESMLQKIKGDKNE